MINDEKAVEWQPFFDMKKCYLPMKVYESVMDRKIFDLRRCFLPMNGFEHVMGRKFSD